MHNNHLNVEFRSDLRFFAFYVANRTLIIRETDIDYAYLLLNKDNALGQLFSIFVNSWKPRDNNLVSIKEKHKNPIHRAAQWLLNQCDKNYIVEPPFQEWELEIIGVEDNWKNEIKKFALILGQGILEPTLLDNIDYMIDLLEYGSTLESVFAVLSNVILIDNDDKVVNKEFVFYRTAQCVKNWAIPEYNPEPPFENWEQELH